VSSDTTAAVVKHLSVCLSVCPSFCRPYARPSVSQFCLASPGNQHCANCIGTLSFLIVIPTKNDKNKSSVAGRTGVCRTFSQCDAVERAERAAELRQRRGIQSTKSGGVLMKQCNQRTRAPTINLLPVRIDHPINRYAACSRISTVVSAAAATTGRSIYRHDCHFL